MMIGDISLTQMGGDLKKKKMKSAPLTIQGSTRFDTAPQQLDHTLSLDLSACSPTGATLYESPEANVCGSSGSVRTGFVFDLPPQYEQSNDLSMYPYMLEVVDNNLGQTDMCLGLEKNTDAMCSSTVIGSSGRYDKDDLCSNDMDDGGGGGGLITSRAMSKQGPTLAQLNGNDNVFDDIESIIMTDCMLSAASGNNVVKEEEDDVIASPVPVDQSWKTAGTSASMISSSSAMITLASPQPEAARATINNLATANDSSVTAKTSLEKLLLGVTPQAASPVTSPILIQQLTSPQKASSSSSSPPAASQLLTQVLISSQSLPVIKNENTTLVIKPTGSINSNNKRTTTVTTAATAAASAGSASNSTSTSSTSTSTSTATRGGLEGNNSENRTTLPGQKRSNSPGSDGSIEKKWEEIMEFINNEDDLKEPEEKKIKIEPQDVAYNPCDPMDSRDDDFDSDGGSDQENDLSDNESITSHSSFVEDFIASGRKEKRYFWQYNMQAKGPKGKRLCKVVEPVDPHVLNDFEDPVFDPELNEMRYKHNGKARRGDGNDITPNPQKLFNLGTELNHLNKKINCMTPVSELPVPVRSTSRREKNKYASRACRLKKKAQHEANKLKLHGLQLEHHQLMFVLASIKHLILSHLKAPTVKIEETFTDTLERLVKDNLRSMIAGHTAEYVNCVLEKVAMGDATGEIYSDKQDTSTSGGSLVNCDSWA